MADPSECPSVSEGLLPPELHAWMLLLAATGAVEQELRSAVKDGLDVSHDEFLVLCLLGARPAEGVRMTKIAELLGRPKTRLTYQIACLQHAGLVTRKSVCGDKRGSRWPSPRRAGACWRSPPAPSPRRSRRR